MSAYESLLPWQQHFVDAYVEHAHAPSAMAAFRIARPDHKSPGSASSVLMAKPEIQQAIDERMERKREVSEVNEAWVLSRLQAIAERCMQPLFFPDGSLKRAMTDATNAVRALELLGRHFGSWKDRGDGGTGNAVQVVQVVKFYDDDERPRLTHTAGA